MPALAARLMLMPTLAAMPAGAALADAAACVAIPGDPERLACYDRALGRPVPARAEAVLPAPVAPPEVAPAPVSAPAPPPAIAEPASPAAAAPAAAFGKPSLPAAPAPAAEREPERIEATVVGHVDGLAKGQDLLLDNGQRWRSVDDREFDVVGDNPRVTLWRNLIGSYWLRFEPRGPQLRVRRVQ